MTIRELKDRWKDNNEIVNSKLTTILRIVKNGGELNQDLSPFKKLDNSFADFRGIDFNKREINKVEIKDADLSYSNFLLAWVEKSEFNNVIFKKSNLSRISDLGNEFTNVSFLDCVFNCSGIGYNGSKYNNCVFEKANFSRTSFIRAEFNSCSFINCKIKNIDFQGSSFENCVFVGNLEDVWFRGTFPSDFFIKEYGYSRKNTMKNVSFEEASLNDLTFSNNCDLSTVKLPISGNYYYFDNWKKKLERLQSSCSSWIFENKKEAEIFSEVHLVHAKQQDSYILNVDDIRSDYGLDVADDIISNLLEN